MLCSGMNVGKGAWYHSTNATIDIQLNHTLIYPMEIILQQVV